VHFTFDTDTNVFLINADNYVVQLFLLV